MSGITPVTEDGPYTGLLLPVFPGNRAVFEELGGKLARGQIASLEDENIFAVGRGISANDKRAIEFPSFNTLSGLLPNLPYIETAEYTLSVTDNGDGTVTVDADQSFIMRGVLRFFTNDYTVDQRTFTVANDKTYHLRLSHLPENKDEHFSLNDLADSGYNTDGLESTDLVFNSTFDDMLVARMSIDADGNISINSEVNSSEINCFAETTTSISENADFVDRQQVAMTQGSDIAYFSDSDGNEFIVSSNLNSSAMAGVGLELFKKINGQWVSQQVLDGDYSQTKAVEVFKENESIFVVTSIYTGGYSTPLHILPFNAGLIADTPAQILPADKVLKIRVLKSSVDDTVFISTTAGYTSSSTGQSYVYKKHLTDAQFIQVGSFASGSAGSSANLFQMDDGKIFLFVFLYSTSSIKTWNKDAQQFQQKGSFQAGYYVYVSDISYFQDSGNHYLVMNYGTNAVFKFDPYGSVPAYMEKIQTLQGSQTNEIYSVGESINLLTDDGTGHLVRQIFNPEFQQFGAIQQVIDLEANLAFGEHKVVTDKYNKPLLLIPGYQDIASGSDNANGDVYRYGG